MNIDEQAAATIMSARHSDAFTQEACEQILRNNLSGGVTERPCAASHIAAESEIKRPRDVRAKKQEKPLPAQSLQPKPESWPEIAREAVDVFCNFHTNVTTRWAQGCLEQAFYDAIERSHVAQPQWTSFCESDGRGHCRHCGAAQPQPSKPQRSEAEQIRYGKVGCKGGIMSEGAHLEQHSDQPPFTPPPSGAQLAWQEMVQEGDQPSGCGRTTDDKQEWTCEKGHPDDIWIICIGGLPKCSVQGESVAKLLCDAHKVELAAEREKSEKLGWLLLEAGKNIAAERKRREQAEHWLEDKRSDAAMFAADASKYHGRLLSALAAIEDWNNFVKNAPMAPMGAVIKVDLSALRKHDDGVITPLVKSARKLLDYIDSNWPGKRSERSPVRELRDEVEKHERH